MNLAAGSLIDDVVREIWRHKRINPAALRPGIIGHTKSSGFFSSAIRKVLKSWGGHDNLVVIENERIGFGDAVMPRAKVNSVQYYNNEIAAGRMQIRFFEVIGATPEQEKAAARWWMSPKGAYRKRYDWWAFPRLLWKAIFMDIFQRAAGMEWLWYCTEGVGAAYIRGAGLNPYRPKATNFTPLTTEKRAGIYGPVCPITLAEITNKIMMDL